MKNWFVDDFLYRRIERGTGVAQRENDRREERGIWAGHSKRIVGPPDSGSSTSGSYVVSCTDARPSPPTHFPPPLPHPRTCLLVTGKNSAASNHALSSEVVSAVWRAQRENDLREGPGILGGDPQGNLGPPRRRVSSPPDLRVFID